MKQARRFRLLKLKDSLRIWSEEEIMIEFARLHVTKALKQANEKAKIKCHVANKDDNREYKVIDKDSILNSYDLNNIK